MCPCRGDSVYPIHSVLFVSVVPTLCRVRFGKNYSHCLVWYVHYHISIQHTCVEIDFCPSTCIQLLYDRTQGQRLATTLLGSHLGWSF